MATIEERAYNYAITNASNIQDWDGNHEIMVMSYEVGAQDQDRIARAEERERCIKVAQDVTCRMCECNCREEKKYLCPLYSAIRNDIMKGGNYGNN